MLYYLYILGPFSSKSVHFTVKPANILMSYILLYYNVLYSTVDYYSGVLHYTSNPIQRLLHAPMTGLILAALRCLLLQTVRSHNICKYFQELFYNQNTYLSKLLSIAVEATHLWNVGLLWLHSVIMPPI